MKALLALRFLLELAIVAGAALAGASASWIFAILFPLAVVVIWSVLIAPKSVRRLADPARLLLELAIFGGVGSALIACGALIFGAVLAGAAMAEAVALRWSEPDKPAPQP